MKILRPKSRFTSLILLGGIGSPLVVHAGGLADQVGTLFGSDGIQVETGSHTAHFSSASLSTLGLLTQQLAVSAVDIPAISTAPGLTFKYNPALQAFERSSGSLGSIYIERPLTIGQGKMDFGFSYTYVNFDTLDGQKLNGLSFPGLQHGDCCISTGLTGFELATADLTFEKFSLQSHIFNFQATYGITDKWDVNILLPVIQTDLDITARAQINEAPGFSGTHDFPNGTDTETQSTSGSHLGVGDIQLRTKYHFLSYNQFNMAGGVNLRLPSGSQSNLQGVGDTTVTPYLSFSQDYSIINLHATAGVEFNTGNTGRDRIRYAGGATFQVTPSFGLITDFIGTSNIRTNQVSVRVPQFTGSNTTPSSYNIVTQTINNDTLDLALGFKFIPVNSVVGFFNVFIPLNNAGLRSDLIPSGGLQVAF